MEQKINKLIKINKQTNKKISTKFQNMKHFSKYFDILIYSNYSFFYVPHRKVSNTV